MTHSTDTSMVELEPFDAKLAQRIQALSAQIEHQTLQLANLRRKAPQETAQKFTQSFEKQSEEYEARLKADEQAKIEVAKATSVDVGNVERIDEMQNTWKKGNDELAALKSGLGGTVARMERAQKAAEIVEER
jgi:kinetochor protein Mis14/NSL1